MHTRQTKRPFTKYPPRAMYPVIERETRANLLTASREWIAAHDGKGRSRKARLSKLARLVPAYLFFRENSGGIVGENAQGALKLARAERYADAHGWEFTWEDGDECIGCDCGSEDCPCATGKRHECFVCCVVDAKGQILASLGSICEPSTQYRRQIQAELALEAMPCEVSR